MAKHDEQVAKLLKEVETRKANLGERPRAALVTNGILKFADRSHININTINSIDAAVEAYAQVVIFRDTAKKAAGELGIPNYEPLISGYVAADWKKDFELQVAKFQYNLKKEELIRIEKKLESLMSDDLKTSNELAAIAELLGN